MQTLLKNRASAVAVIAGAGLTIAGVGVSSAGIEHLLGQPRGALLWGPLLFRALLVFHGVLLIFFGGGGVRSGNRALGPASASNRAAIHWTPWIVLSGLSIVALALRLWQLGSCLWFDEIITLLDFARPPFATIISSFPSQNQHMLFSLMAHASIRIFGDTVWAVRLPSVIFGVASLWALFLLGRYLLDERESLLACALMTVSYHHIWFSQNARGYMGLLFFSTLATWLWLEALSRPMLRWWILYAVTIALGLWTHLTMMFVPAAHAILQVVLWLRGTDTRSGISESKTAFFRHPLVAWLLCATFTLQLYALALPQFFHGAAEEGVRMKTEWADPLYVVREGLRGLNAAWSGGVVVLFAGLLVALAGFVSIWRRDWRAAAAMVLPGVLAAATMLALGHPLWPRFLFFSMGFALLIAVAGAMTVARMVIAPLSFLADRKVVAARVGVSLVILLIVASVLMLPRYYARPKQDFIGAREFVERQSKPGDTVVAVGLAGIAYKRYYAPGWMSVSTHSELDALRNRGTNLWLVYTIPAQLRTDDPELMREVENDFHVVRVFPGTLGGGDVVVCQPGGRQNVTIAPSSTHARASNQEGLH